MTPIFAFARLDPSAPDAFRALRGRGIRTAVVTKTPWVSPAAQWREELDRALAPER